MNNFKKYFLAFKDSIIGFKHGWNNCSKEHRLSYLIESMKDFWPIYEHHIAETKQLQEMDELIRQNEELMKILNNQKDIPEEYLETLNDDIDDLLL